MNETTYTCSRCLLPCEVAVASPLVNRTQEEPLSLCCNAPAEPVKVTHLRVLCATPSCPNRVPMSNVTPGPIYCPSCLQAQRLADPEAR